VRGCLGCGFILPSREDFMFDLAEDTARAIGIAVPHWLLSAINGAAALVLLLVI
jgi:hypothetical protein